MMERIGHTIGGDKADGQRGFIEVIEKWNVFGRLELVSLEWQGGPLLELGEPITRFNIGAIQKGNRVTVGPYRLRLVENNDYPPFWFRYIREDSLMGWLYFIWHRATRPLDGIYRRSILTLAIWGLARYGEATSPHWRDIHALRWIAEKMGK